MIPAGRIELQRWMTARPARAVLAALTANGAIARFVGGCVRDAILGRKVTDVDIATPEPPEAVIRLLEDHGIRAIPTGIDHGTVTAVIRDAHYEITTLRRDVETYGRRARVSFTDDWEADAARRDFTMNALFCDPDGTLYDPTGGYDDLAAGRVRFVGAARERIKEDVLRLLRFFRFHAWYGRGAPDAEALQACRKLAPRLAGLSAERVWSELRRLLAAPAPAPVLTLMADHGVLTDVLPEAGRPDRVKRLAALCVIETRLGLPADPVRRLAATVSVDEAGAAALAARLRLSRHDTERITVLSAPALRPSPFATRQHNRLALYRHGAARFRDLVLIAWAGDGDEGWRALWTLPEDDPVPDFPLAGRDALALGVPQGARVGELLAAVESWWIEGGFAADRESCLARLETLARRPG